MSLQFKGNVGLIASLAVVILAMVSLFYVEKGDVVLWINHRRNYILDTSMPYLTFLGDGLFYALVAAILFFRNKQVGKLLIIAGLANMLISYVLKKYVFGPIPRPTSFFTEGQLDLIQGVDYAHLFSFPSGHTMTAFTLATLLNLTIVSSKYQWLLLFGAMVAAFSRIYLLQHFYIDVVAGEVIGISIGMIVYYAAGKIRLEKR
jgi:membrane-associated phospholipid phosphatase